MARDRNDATTSELRHDWLADRWVIIAPQRTERPHDFVRKKPIVADSHDCPFCFGREEETPAAVACYMPSHGSSPPKWHVRVVPNKFPAVNGVRDGVAYAGTKTNEGLLGADASSKPEVFVGSGAASVSDLDAATIGGVDLFQRRSLTGGHEVIVESPLHLQSITQLDRQTTSLVFRAYRDRLSYWLNDCGLAYAVVFKNVGQDAGASLFHTHSQLIATDILPTDVERAAKRMQLFEQQESSCLFCRMKDDELEHGSRIVEQSKRFVAFCPFASRLPSLLTVLPKQHQSSFESMENDELDELSWLIHRLVRRVERCYPDAAYNFVIHTAPRCENLAKSFHWRMEIFPRLTTVAGFEWGSDCYINPIAPESAAESLRLAGI